MTRNHRTSFLEFEIDLEGERVYTTSGTVDLRPKAFAVLRILAAVAPAPVARDEIIAAVWRDVHVSSSVLTGCINELRSALGDDPRQPRIIQTVHSRGYRLIATPASPEPTSANPSSPEPTSTHPASTETVAIGRGTEFALSEAGPFVGRESALETLRGALGWARASRRQTVVVSGEAGIGKTRLLERFRDECAIRGGLWIGLGGCLEQSGVGDAYLPVIEAFSQLCRGTQSATLRKQLTRLAPHWMAQLPRLIDEQMREQIEAAIGDASGRLPINELVEAFEEASGHQPIVLVIEDLHWCDRSSLELLAKLSTRTEPAAILVVLSYRNADGNDALGVLRERLARSDAAHFVALPRLSLDDVVAYVRGRYDDPPDVDAFSSLLHRRSDGNPLHMASLAEMAEQLEAIVDTETGWKLQGNLDALRGEVPDSMRLVIDGQFARLAPDEIRILELASTSGETFSVAEIAAGDPRSADEIAARCEGLAERNHLLTPRDVVDWPDGTVTPTFRFAHALYRDAMYDRIPASRRLRYHRAVAERLEVGFAGAEVGISAALAHHFERCGDTQKAIVMHGKAGNAALHRQAHPEAILHFNRARGLLEEFEHRNELREIEMQIEHDLGKTLIATDGFAADSVRACYARVDRLSAASEQSPFAHAVIWGLWVYSVGRGEMEASLAHAERRLQFAVSRGGLAHIAMSKVTAGISHYYLGNLSASLELLEQAALDWEQVPEEDKQVVEDVDILVASLTYSGWVIWLMGRRDDAWERIRSAHELAVNLGHRHTEAVTRLFLAWLHQLDRSDPADTLRESAGALAFAAKHGFAQWTATAYWLHGWARAATGDGQPGVDQMVAAIGAFREAGARMMLPAALSMLAEAQATVGAWDAALGSIDDALQSIELTGECYYEAEVCRIQAELYFRRSESDRAEPGDIEQAEFLFRRAAKIGLLQGTRMFELRARTGLVRVLDGQSSAVTARRELAALVSSFTQGGRGRDLREARQLLAR